MNLVSGKTSTGQFQDVPRPLDDSQLETEADTQEGNLLLSCPLDGKQHSLRSAFSKAARNEDTAVSVFNLTLCATNRDRTLRQQLSAMRRGTSLVLMSASVFQDLRTLPTTWF
jgi:hypothetical protein